MQSIPKPMSVTRRNLVKAAAITAAGAAVAGSLNPRTASANSISERIGMLLGTGDDDVVEETPETPAAAGTSKYQQLVCARFDEEGLHYTAVDGYSIRIGYYGDNLESIDLFINFDEDEDPYVHIVSWSIGSATEQNRTAVINACNEMNDTYYWVKFYVDDDNDVTINVDAIVDDATCGAEIREFVGRAVAIIDDAYPIIAEAMQGGTSL